MLISLRDFTISLRLPQYLDVSPVSVPGTCQSYFTQPRRGKLICKLNESPESCQEELPWARLLVVLSRGAPQPALILLPMLPTLSALQLLIQTGIYIFIYIKKRLFLFCAAPALEKKKGMGEPICHGTSLVLKQLVVCLSLTPDREKTPSFSKKHLEKKRKGSAPKQVRLLHLLGFFFFWKQGHIVPCTAPGICRASLAVTPKAPAANPAACSHPTAWGLLIAGRQGARPIS